MPEASSERRDLGQIEIETETEPCDSARPGTTERVRSAVRMGVRHDTGACSWLPLPDQFWALEVVGIREARRGRSWGIFEGAAVTQGGLVLSVHQAWVSLALSVWLLWGKVPHSRGPATGEEVTTNLKYLRLCHV